MKIVISLGGSVIVQNKVNEKFIKQFSSCVEKTKNKYHIICGGGKTARTYMNVNLTTLERDLLGIEVTKLNANLVSKYFKNAKVMFDEPKKIGLAKERIIISAGWKPGSNTDYDAALICKTYKPDLFVNISNVKWIYDKNPRKYKNAKPIKNMSYDDFIKLAKDFERKPGVNFIFEPRAMKILKQVGVKSIFIDSSIANLEKVLSGKKFVGTIVE